MSRRVERCYNIAELRKLAKSNMPAPMFHYIDGAADDEWTLRRNTAAFDSVEFLPRTLVDVSTIDMSTTLFGQRIDWPYFCSPTALQRLFHHEGEGGTARAAHASGTIFSLSSVSSTNIEDAAKLIAGAEGVPGLHVQGSEPEPRVRAAREGFGLRRAAAHGRRHGVRQSRARHRDRHDGAAEARR